MPDVEHLEAVVVDLIERKYAAREGSAEHRMAIRQLIGLRLSREEAGPMMEDLDPLGPGVGGGQAPPVGDDPRRARPGYARRAPLPAAVPALGQSCTA